jgi:hypothetical protein
MYTSTSQHLEASQAKQMKTLGTAVNATFHGFGSPWSFIHLFIYSRSMELYKVTEPYGYGNSQQILQFISNDIAWTDSVSHCTITVPSMDQLNYE